MSAKTSKVSKCKKNFAQLIDPIPKPKDPNCLHPFTNRLYEHEEYYQNYHTDCEKIFLLGSHKKSSGKTNESAWMYRKKQTRQNMEWSKANF